MFISFDEVREGKADDVAVAIIGTGPAGISLALDLAERGIASLLVEAGGFTYPDPAGLDPYLGKSAPRPYPVQVSRLRFFGGTSGHWGGWCRPLDEADFKPIPGVPHTGWPITREEAYRFLPQAHKLLDIPNDDYDSREAIAAAAETAIDPGKDSGFQTALFRFSTPTRFGTRYKDAIESSKLVRCVLNTSLLKVERGEGGRTRLVLKGGAGGTKTLQARAHVLAMGGIENPRALLWSNRGLERPFGGSGDWIGRCFVDHFGMSTVKMLARPGLNYTRRESALGDLMSKNVPTQARVLAGETSNHMLSLAPAEDESLVQPEYGGNTMLFGPGAARQRVYSLQAVSGQRPNRDSRVLLDGELDVNGVARPILDWRVMPEDYTAVLDSVARFGRAVSMAGLGRFRKVDFRVREPAEALSSGLHHIGTTRMGASEKEGCVDANCRVFGTDDLYVAGSSLFPTSGYANPTLTIVALALRLSEHLGASLKEGQS